MDPSGNFVVVWESYIQKGVGQDANSNGIYGQRFDANGTALAGEFLINTTTIGNQTQPDVSMNAVGNFVVVWQGPQAGNDANEDIFAQRFDSNGQTVGDEFRVNTHTEFRQLSPCVAINNDGKFIIVWESIDQSEPNRPICCQSYDNLGSPVGPELVISDEPSVCYYPDVALDSTGEAIVVWTGKISLYSLHVRHFAADGNSPSYGSSPVNDGLKFTSLTRASIAVDSADNYVIAWDGHSQDADYDDVYLKRYHWSHIALHEQYLVNTQQTADQTNPSVAVCDNSFVIVWEDDSKSESTERNILGRRFVNQGDEIGQPILLGDEFLVNTYTVGDQKYPAVAIRGDENFVSVWQSDGQDGSGNGVFGQTGPKTGSADFTDDGLVNFTDYCVLAAEWLKNGNPLKADIVDDNKIDKQDLTAICRQWLMPCYQCSRIDINSSGKIDFKDYNLLAGNWSKKGPKLDGDFTANGIVNTADLKAMLFSWLKTCQQ